MPRVTVTDNKEPLDDAESFTGQGPGPAGRLARRAIGRMAPSVAPPSRFPGRTAGHTTSGLDVAMSNLADDIHPVG